MASNVGWDAVFQELATNEHDDLGQVVEMLARLQRLRDVGFAVPEMTDEMAGMYPRAPGGRSWDDQLVIRMLGLVDSIRDEQRRSGLTTPVAGTPTSDPTIRGSAASGSSAPDSAVTRPAGAGSPLPGRAVIPPTGGGSQPPGSAPRRYALPPLPDTRPADQRVVRVRSSQPVRYRQPYDSRWPSPAKLAVGLLAVLVVGASVYGAYLSSTSGDEAGTETADGDTTEPLAVERSVVGATADTEDPSSNALDLAPPPIEEGDEEDMLAIRIEPPTDTEPPPGGPAAATATIRNDGLLYVEGAFQTQDQADLFLTRAAGVFGTDNIVEDYVVDANAPVPGVADVSLDKPVLFESGTATIDPSYIPFLEACGDVLKLNPRIVMSVSAFTDSVGDEEFNLTLSQERAQAVVDFYRNLDIDDSQLIGTGFGETSPISDNDTDEGRQQNRRAMLELLNVMDEETLGPLD